MVNRISSLAVRKSHSDLDVHWNVNLNRNTGQSWLTWIKCKIGFGTEEECKTDQPKRTFSAPGQLEQELDDVKSVCTDLRTRIYELENQVEQKQTPCQEFEGEKGFKKRKVRNPYLQFYSPHCGKQPKSCPILKEELNPVHVEVEDESKLRLIVSRSRSKTPKRSKRRLSPSPTKKSSKVQDPVPEKSQFKSPKSPKVPRSPKSPKANRPVGKMCSQCNLPCCSPGGYMPAPPACRTTLNDELINFKDSCPSFPVNGGAPVRFSSPRTKVSPPKACVSLPCPPKPCACPCKPSPCPKPCPPKPCGCPKPKPCPPKPCSQPKKPCKICPGKGNQQREPRQATRSACPCPAVARPCNPYCRPTQSSCLPGCNLDKDSTCVFSGLGNSYRRSKSGDALCRTLFSKYTHGGYGGTHDAAPFTDPCPAMGIPGLNRTNSRKSISPDRVKSAPKCCVTYASKPREQRDCMEVKLKNAIYSPCVKQIGPRSPVVLYHALKKVEPVQRKVFKKRAPKPTELELFRQSCAFTLDDLEKDIYKHVSSPRSEPNTNNGALNYETDEHFQGNFGLNYNRQRDEALALKHMENYLNQFLPKNESPKDCNKNNAPELSRKTSTTGSSEDSFRFFRRYLRITAAQSSTTIGDTEAPPHDSETALDGDNQGNNHTDDFDHQLIGREDVSILDKWALGEFPEIAEDTSTKTYKTTPLKRKTSSMRSLVRNKSSITKVGKKRSTPNMSVGTRSSLDLDVTKRPIVVNRSTSPVRHLYEEVVRNQRQMSFERSPEVSVYTDRGHSASPVRYPDTCSEREEYTPFFNPDDDLEVSESQSNFEDNDEEVIPYEHDMIGDVETIKYADGKQVDGTRRNKVLRKTPSPYIMKRGRSPRSPRTKSLENRPTTTNNEVDKQCPGENVDNIEMPKNRESCVDGAQFETKHTNPDPDKTQGFLSRFTSMWGSKSTSPSTITVVNDTGTGDSETPLCIKDSSVDVQGVGSSPEIVAQGSSVDTLKECRNGGMPVLDGSSNNEYRLIIDDIESQDDNFISELQEELGNITNFETNVSANQTSGDHASEDLFLLELNQSQNNGGDDTETGEDGKVKDTNVDIDVMSSPVLTSQDTDDPQDSPIEVPAPGVISARVASMNLSPLQQLLGGSGALWTRVDAQEDDVANIRLAKEEFMKRLRAKQARDAKQIDSDKTLNVANSQPEGGPEKPQLLSAQELGNSLVDEMADDEDGLGASGAICPQ